MNKALSPSGSLLKTVLQLKRGSIYTLTNFFASNSKFLMDMVTLLSTNNEWTNGYGLMDMGSPSLQLYSKVMYGVADQKLVICITHTSILSKLEENIEGIPSQCFRIHSFADFEANCDLRGDLHDVVSHLKLVDGQALHQRPVLRTKDGSTSQKIMVPLQLKDGPVMNVYLWDQAADYPYEHRTDYP